MKKSFILWIAMLTTCMASAQVSTWNGTHEPWTHGTGTEADPFLIENAQQLAYLAYRVNNGLDAGARYRQANSPWPQRPAVDAVSSPAIQR